MAVHAAEFQAQVATLESKLASPVEKVGGDHGLRPAVLLIAALRNTHMSNCREETAHILQWIELTHFNLSHAGPRLIQEGPITNQQEWARNEILKITIFFLKK